MGFVPQSIKLSFEHLVNSKKFLGEKRMRIPRKNFDRIEKKKGGKHFIASNKTTNMRISGKGKRNNDDVKLTCWNLLGLRENMMGKSVNMMVKLVSMMVMLGCNKS